MPTPATPRAMATRPGAERRTADGEDGRHVAGRTGEELAAAVYQRQGFQLLGLRQRTRAGEVDLLVRRGALLVGVEVKTRTQDPNPEAAVDQVRLDRVRRALWQLALCQEPLPRRLRVDVAAVLLGPTPQVRVFHGDEFALA